jgi:VWFA-related protein
MTARVSRLTWCLAALALLTSVNAQESLPTFRSTADAVRVDVSVQRGGRPVAGLTIADFDLFDDGAAQTITNVSYERLPIDVTVALDVSSSVSGRLLADLRRSIEQLEGRLREGDRLKLIAFNMRVRRILDFTSRGADTRPALESVAAAGSTALFDTLAVALMSAAAADRRQLILLFTDGSDTSSITDPAVLLEVASRTTSTLAFVGPPRSVSRSMPLPPATMRAQSSSSETPPAGAGIRPLDESSVMAGSGLPAFFARLAGETGGVVVTLPDVRGASLATTFGRILDDFRSSYVLHFTPQPTGGKGFRTLRVVVKREGPFVVRARRGYVR